VLEIVGLEVMAEGVRGGGVRK